jgi:NADPH:quinone reductase
MPKTMRAIVLSGPVAPDELTVTDMPVPEVRPGWVRIRIKAFGVNESEVTSRKGESGPDFAFPRILGIEGAGIDFTSAPVTGLPAVWSARWSGILTAHGATPQPAAVDRES